MGKLAALTALLIAELEALLVTHYELRTQLRELFHLPLYHVVLTFVTLLLLVVMFSPEWRERLLSHLRFRPLALVGHLAVYLGLWLLFERTASIGTSALTLPLWAGLGAFFLASWLAIWLPFARWLPLLREQGPVLAAMAVLSLLTDYLAEGVSGLWLSFGRVTFYLTEALLSNLYGDVVVDPGQLLLGTRRFFIVIQPGCSGFEGMGLMLVLSGSYLGLRHRQLHWPWAALLVPVAVVLAYVSNLLRLLALIVIGTEISPSIALRGFHSQAGWISFTLVGLGLIGLMEWLHRPARPSVPQEVTPTPTLAYVAPMIALIFSTMLVQAASGRFAYAYPLKVLPAFLLLAYYRGEYADLRRKPDGAAVLVGLLTYALWLLLVKEHEAVSPFVALPTAWAWVWLVFRLLGTVLVVPACEELAFRGYLVRQLAGLGRVGALLVSTVAFASIHSDPSAGLMAGLLYGLLAMRRGLGQAVYAHALTNLLLFTQALAYSQWSLL